MRACRGRQNIIYTTLARDRRGYGKPDPATVRNVGGEQPRYGLLRNGLHIAAAALLWMISKRPSC